MQALNCPNCGAALPAHAAKLNVVTCEFCNTTFRVPRSFTPEPDMGDLLLSADFSKKPMPGWGLLNEANTMLIGGNPACIRAQFDAQTGVYDILATSGLYDNLDASVTMTFLEGNVEYVRAGMFLRYQAKVGGYGFLVSAQCSYKMGFYEAKEDGSLTWKDIIPWTSHTALRAGLNQSNRLRVLANGDRLRVYLNGVMATSIKHDKFDVGKVTVSVEPCKESNITVAFSDLQLREVIRVHFI
ncbi:MAG: hypothetical protein AB1649_25960 [Chloroflexota bacterium]